MNLKYLEFKSSKVFVNTTLAILLAQPIISFAESKTSSITDCEKLLPNYLERAVAGVFDPRWKARFENCQTSNYAQLEQRLVDEAYAEEKPGDQEYRKTSSNRERLTFSAQYDLSNAHQFKQLTPTEKGRDNQIDSLPGYGTISP